MRSIPRFRLLLGGLGLDVHVQDELDLSAFEERGRRYARAAGQKAHDVLSVRGFRRWERRPEVILPLSRVDESGVLCVETQSLRLFLSPVHGHSEAAIAGVAAHLQFENLLRILLSRRLLQMGGAMLHAAGLVKSGIGFAFPGVSGAGKSTLTLRQPAHTRISEDLLALTRGDRGAWQIEALPFLAAHALDLGPKRATLAGLAFPRHSVRVSTSRLGRQACRFALARALVCFAPQGVEALILERILEIAAEIPAWDLELDLVTPFWPALEAQLEAPNVAAAQ